MRRRLLLLASALLLGGALCHAEAPVELTDYDLDAAVAGTLLELRRGDVAVRVRNTVEFFDAGLGSGRREGAVSVMPVNISIHRTGHDTAQASIQNIR